MPGPDPNPKSIEPAASACCNCPSPRKVEISTSRPADFQMPDFTPSSRPENGKEELIAFPTRSFVNGCACPGPPKHKSAPGRMVVSKLRRLVRIEITRLLAAIRQFRHLQLAFFHASARWQRTSRFPPPITGNCIRPSPPTQCRKCAHR